MRISHVKGPICLLLSVQPRGGGVGPYLCHNPKRELPCLSRESMEGMIGGRMEGGVGSDGIQSLNR